LSSYTSYTQKIPDSLKQKSSKELIKRYKESTTKEQKIFYINCYLKLAKNNNDKHRVYSGYYMLAGLYNDDNVIKYSDSIINLTLKDDTKYFPALAYQKKAHYYQINSYQYVKAIDNFMLANEAAKKHNYENLIMKINYSMGTLKRRMGEFEEAIKMIKKSLVYAEKDKEKKQNLISIVELSNAYTEYKKNDSARYYTKLGINEAKVQNDSAFIQHLTLNSGIIDYNENKYSSAIDKISSTIDYFISKKSDRFLIYVYFYLGESYKGLKQKERAINYHKKVDSLFQIKRTIFPFIRKSYTSLIDNYKNKNNLQQQLFYVNRLIKFDSIINVNSNYVNKTIYTEYDIPKLKEEKQQIEKKLESNKILSTQIVVFLSVIIIIILSLFLYQYQRKKFYRKRVDQILNSKVKEKTKEKVQPKTTNSINIPSGIIDTILIKLEEFENKKQFLDNKITLNSLAKDFNTNSNYLSKIINSYKNTSFNSYINSLRIDYVIQELKTNAIYRKYTVKAIAEEIGFNNSESFSNAFKKTTGITPSFFIKELNKN